MPLKGLVFDVDGTLLDQEGAERDALRSLYEGELAGRAKPGFHVFLRDWRNVADEYLRLFLDNRLGFDAQRIARIRALLSKYGPPCPPDEAEALHQAYAAYYRSQWRAFPDARPALEDLRTRYTLAVITNGDGAQQRAKLEATGLAPLFAHILVSGDVRIAKPSPGIFRLCEQGLGMEPDELAYVGDRLDVDLAGARAAEWTPVWLDRRGMPGEGTEGGLVVAKNLGELKTLLEAGR